MYICIYKTKKAAAQEPSSAFQRFLASRCSFSRVFAGPSFGDSV